MSEQQQLCSIPVCSELYIDLASGASNCVTISGLQLCSQTTDCRLQYLSAAHAPAISHRRLNGLVTCAVCPSQAAQLQKHHRQPAAVNNWPAAGRP